MPPKKVTPRGQAAEPAGAKAVPAKRAATKAKPAPKKQTSSTAKYVRNIRGVDVRVTFDTGRKIVLSPRGQRNDMTAISKDELDDPIFLNNLGSLYEVISSSEAQEIREKQLTNAASYAHPRPEQILTDPLGQPGNFTGLTPSNVDSSITIGHLSETGGRNNEEKSIEVTRSVQPGRAEVPGSASSDQYGQPVSIAPLPPISERN
jgi:hypothetical protein